MKDSTPSLVVCADCDSPAPVTSFGSCGICGSSSVLRFRGIVWPWLAAVAAKNVSRRAWVRA